VIQVATQAGRDSCAAVGTSLLRRCDSADSARPSSCAPTRAYSSSSCARRPGRGAQAGVATADRRRAFGSRAAPFACFSLIAMRDSAAQLGDSPLIGPSTLSFCSRAGPHAPAAHANLAPRPLWVPPRRPPGALRGEPAATSRPRRRGCASIRPARTSQTCVASPFHEDCGCGRRTAACF